ncbi:3-hydroxyisobutyrate dehydrogenase [Paracoccus isoporae]|uniref:3-hydroxyisobutyrate dehydrogenase n=1 Tax=Paracoccus isoporae TaxID=591205 RepID=A0A1G7DKL0_9RHOB|nr:NAD(P)-dependent oxidoreductase [Paracoccus isoporae]SDE52104.1 3-hydroxyisobutyrate dehydrogenase [Paracoccus isoporae]
MIGPVAFLGTGLMGGPMCRNLARAGAEIRAWNRSPEKAQAIGEGVAVATSPAAAAQDAAACIVMLSDGPTCRKILIDDGAAAALAPGALLIVMSSIGHQEAVDLAAEASGMGLRWIDAPVSGGTPAAAAGTLSIMAGGRADDLDAAAPLLTPMGNVVHIGPAGTGALTKLINQITVASTIATVAEAMLLAEQGGADPRKVREALMGGFAASRILDLHGQRMIEGDFEPGGPARYQLKDTRAARDVAKSLGLDLPVLDLVDGLFDDLVAQGGGGLDHAALLLELRRRNGLAQGVEALSGGAATAQD